MSDRSKDRRTRLAVTDALNGDKEKVDPAVRRSLYALATEGDEFIEKVELIHEAIVESSNKNLEEAIRHSDDRIDGLEKKLDDKLKALDASISVLRKLLVSTSVTFLMTLVGVVVNIIIP